MRREFSRQSNDVKEVEKLECRTGLGLVDRCGKPFAPQELLTMRDALIAAAEVDSDIMEAVRVQDKEILMTSNRQNTRCVDVAQLHA